LSLLAAGLAALSLSSPVPSFRHVVVIVFENKERGDVVGNRSATAFARLARAGAMLPHYYAVAHPSLPNYLALVSGSTQGIDSDCTDCSATGPSLADSLGAAGRTWKTYAEGLPRPGFTGAFAGRYAKKHDPFAYFRAVDRRRIVPFAQLRRDLAAGALPDFSLVVPDLCHDMHDCSVATGDAWLARTIRPLLRVPETAVFVVFDEGTTDRGGGGNVPAFVVGTAVRGGTVFIARTGHYGLLRTIEEAWSLPRLGHSAAAAPITGVWR
jgi:hypothetical protein